MMIICIPVISRLFFSIVYQVEPMIGKELESDEEIFSRVSPVK